MEEWGFKRGARLYGVRGTCWGPTQLSGKGVVSIVATAERTLELLES